MLLRVSPTRLSRAVVLRGGRGFICPFCSLVFLSVIWGNNHGTLLLGLL